MPLLIVCPEGHRLKVPSKHAGKEIRCPVCKTPIRVPTLDDEHAATPLPKPRKDPLLRPMQDLRPMQEDRQSLREASPPPQTAPPTVERAEPPSSTSFRVNTDASPGSEERDMPLPGTTASLDYPSLQEGLGEAPNFDFLASHTDLGEGSISVVYEETRPSAEVARPTAHDDRQLHGYLLATVALIVAAVCAIPPMLEHVAARETGRAAVDAWTYLVLLAVTLQIAGALYALRLPDWSTLWVASVIAAAGAALYATGLALTMFAGREHSLVQDLGLLDEVFHQRAQLWCCLAMCVLLILAYAYGRFSVHWYTTERRLSASRL